MFTQSSLSVSQHYTLQAEFVLPSVYIAFPEVFYLEISKTSLNTNIYVLKKHSEVQPFVAAVAPASEQGFSPETGVTGKIIEV